MRIDAVGGELSYKGRGETLSRTSSHVLERFQALGNPWREMETNKHFGHMGRKMQRVKAANDSFR